MAFGVTNLGVQEQTVTRLPRGQRSDYAPTGAYCEAVAGANL